MREEWEGMPWLGSSVSLGTEVSRLVSVSITQM